MPRGDEKSLYSSRRYAQVPSGDPNLQELDHSTPTGLVSDEPEHTIYQIWRGFPGAPRSGRRVFKFWGRDRTESPFVGEVLVV